MQKLTGKVNQFILLDKDEKVGNITNIINTTLSKREVESIIAEVKKERPDDWTFKMIERRLSETSEINFINIIRY